LEFHFIIIHDSCHVESRWKYRPSSLTYILVFLFSFLQYYLFLIANVRKIPNMNFSRFTLTVLLISSVMGSSTLYNWVSINVMTSV
jgi:hypothetical protein